MNDLAVTVLLVDCLMSALTLTVLVTPYTISRAFDSIVFVALYNTLPNEDTVCVTEYFKTRAFDSTLALTEFFFTRVLLEMVDKTFTIFILAFEETVLLLTTFILDLD